MPVWNRRCCCSPGCLGSGCSSYTCPESLPPSYPTTISVSFTAYFPRSWSCRYNAIDSNDCDPQLTGTCVAGDYYSLGAPELISKAVTVTLARDPSVTIDECTASVGYGVNEVISYPSGLFPAFSTNPLGAPAGTFGSLTDTWGGGNDATDFDASDKRRWKVSAVLSYGAEFFDPDWKALSQLLVGVGSALPADTSVTYSVATPQLTYKGYQSMPGSCYCGTPREARASMALDSSAYSNRASPPAVDHTFALTGFANATGQTCEWCESYGGRGCASECTGTDVGDTVITWNGYDETLIETPANAAHQFNGGLYGPIDPAVSCGDSGPGVLLGPYRSGPSEGYIDCEWAGIDQLANSANPTPASGPYITLSDISFTL